MTESNKVVRASQEFAEALEREDFRLAEDWAEAAFRIAEQEGQRVPTTEVRDD